jgi:hypothetical protein
MLGVSSAFYGLAGVRTAATVCAVHTSPKLNEKSFCFDERMDSVDLPHLSFSFASGSQA